MQRNNTIDLSNLMALMSMMNNGQFGDSNQSGASALSFLESLLFSNRFVGRTPTSIGELQGSTPEEKLSSAVKAHSLELVRELLKTQPHLNVNAQNVQTGRTALHEAANCPRCPSCKTIFDALVKEYKADLTIRDKEGFLSAELLAYPHAFNPMLLDSTETMQSYLNHAWYFVSEMNAKLAQNARARGENKAVNSRLEEIKVEVPGVVPEKQKQVSPFPQPVPNAPASKQRIEIVANIEEMLEFIKQHPEYEQIGFALRRPNSTKAELPMHFSPIIFDRKTNNFFQLDSFGGLYLIPQQQGSSFTYSPLIRQRSGLGCWEDTISILYAVLLNFPSFMNFCEKNSVKDTEALASLVPSERQEMQAIRLRASQQASLKNDTDRYTELSNKQMVQTQLIAFEAMERKPHTNIYRMTGWPLQLLHFVERFDLVRNILTPKILLQPATDIVVKRLLETGVKRVPTTTNHAILRHLEARKKSGKEQKATNEIKQYDIAGRNIEERHQTWQLLRANRFAKITNLFTIKLNSDPAVYPKIPGPEDKKSNLSAAQIYKQRAYIADTIASFATGLPQKEILATAHRSTYQKPALRKA